MFETTMPGALRKAREDSKESLRALAARTGIALTKLWRLEQGVAVPSPQERQLLANALPGKWHDLVKAPANPMWMYRELKAQGLEHCGTPMPYFPPRDRESRVRSAAARRQYPSKMKALTVLLRTRPDFLRVNAFCERLTLDSSLECLFVTELLAQGARPAFVAPNWLAPRTPLPVICPRSRVEVERRPFPCLISGEGVFLPQVSFLADRVYTVDFLRHFEDSWSIVEIDGRGHNARDDGNRGLVLGLKVARLTEKQVLDRVRKTLSLAS